MTAIEPPADAPEPPPLPADSRLPQRILAGVCGAILLLVTGVFTLGGAVIAVIGIGVLALITRRRAGGLSVGMSWFAAAVSVQLTLLSISGYAAAKAPPGTMATIQHTMDSAQANPSSPPAWLDRIAPGSSARARAARARAPSPALAKTMLVFTTIFGTGVLAAIVGTIGWLVAFPLAYAVTGRWLGAARGRNGLLLPVSFRSP